MLVKCLITTLGVVRLPRPSGTPVHGGSRGGCIAAAPLHAGQRSEFAKTVCVVASKHWAETGSTRSGVTWTVTLISRARSQMAGVTMQSNPRQNNFPPATWFLSFSARWMAPSIRRRMDRDTDPGEIQRQGQVRPT
jgi:hypothetical protein